MASELCVDSVVRGHHVHKSIWTLALAEELLVEQENDNEHDISAVCIKKDDTMLDTCLGLSHVLHGSF